MIPANAIAKPLRQIRLKKIIDIPKGKIMVVSDLHGNWKDYAAVIQRWNHHLEAGEADHLVFLGDVVHARNKWEDASLPILDDLKSRNCNQKDGKVWCLLGNHEMVHIYHIELWKGNVCYTAEMEEDMTGLREKYIEQLVRMPFMIRTGGGTLLVHAGACRSVGTSFIQNHEVDFEYLREWPHQKLLQKLAESVGISKETNLRSELRPRIGLAFDDLPQSRFLWEMLMNKNERAYGKTYFKYLRQYLNYFSKGHRRGLNLLISGHIQVPFGWEVVDNQQIRISSGLGAENDSFKTYLLIDAATTYKSAWDLEDCTRDVHPLFL